MLGRQRLVAFLAVSDLDAVRDFYSQVLGLTLVEDSTFACVFDGGGTMLRVTRVDSRSVAEHTVLGWEVDRIRSVVDVLADRGVVLERYEGIPQDKRGIWTTPDGSLVAWFKDPEGNVLSLTQSGTDPGSY